MPLALFTLKLQIALAVAYAGYVAVSVSLPMALGALLFGAGLLTLLHWGLARGMTLAVWATLAWSFLTIIAGLAGGIALANLFGLADAVLASIVLYALIKHLTSRMVDQI
ncbi:MAG: hypothetical protein AAGJ96_10315 [Pseudomonadota bacterium]